MRNSILFLSILLILSNCNTPTPTTDSFESILTGVEKIEGRPEYLNSPFVTAGDRLYMVGHQNGTFPDLGWHVTGEMGGIWDHPIKLMDGFISSIAVEGSSASCLNEASSFTNYPFANQHTFKLEGLEVSRFQFVPDGVEGISIDYVIKNTESSTKTVNFTIDGMIDLREVWLGERTNMIDSTDVLEWNETSQSWIGKDLGNEWYVMFGSTLTPVSHQDQAQNCDFERKGKGVNGSISYEIEVPENGSITIPINIAGSYKSKEELLTTYSKLSNSRYDLLKSKKERYEVIANSSKLSIPDKDLEQAYKWVKYNTDWLIRDVPEVGRGICAGIPDYPWWFGVDSEYTLQGAIMIGNRDLVEKNIALLDKLSQSENGNGRIIHAASTNGVVFNPGNINETPQWVSMLWTVYQWTGDKEFLQKYYPTVTSGLNWLLEENDSDNNLLADGFGMMEIHGMNSEMVDVAAYSQKAFADASRMAKLLGDMNNASKYEETAEKLKNIINTDFWVAEYNSYADFIGTKKQALHLLEDAIVRADTLEKPWAVEELEKTKKEIEKIKGVGKQGYVLHHNWVVNTPMEMGIADAEKAKLALETGAQFVNPFGVFVTGIDRDESAGKDESSFGSDRKVFTYTGAVMTLPTGVQTIAENNYGNPDKALDYLQRMTKTFSYALPGSIYEVSPDYGMMTQAWNCYSFAVPIVSQFFGINPDAGNKSITIIPQMPAGWDNAKLESVNIGDNTIDIQYEKTGENISITISQTLDWEIKVGQKEGTYNLKLEGSEQSSSNGIAYVSSNAKSIKVDLARN
ncbi:MAG: glycogen debranching protein [bacterium]|nr:glycogen debranching protein [bacterium]